MKIDKDWIIIAVLFVIIGFLSVQLYKLNTKAEIQIEQIHKQDEDTKRYTAIYYDQTRESLKKTNKDLYDSIEIYKDQIDYLVQFKYQKKYIIDTVYCDTTTVKKEEIKTFEYSNEPNDTLLYTLTLGSEKEPSWYKLDVDVSDKFTIINKKEGDVNITTIDPMNKGNISDVTVIKQDKSSFLDNFAFGPSVTAGYDVVNNNFGIMVGVSLTYKIPLKKRK